ncbi:DUF305 domain-containing protein [Cellulomonas aerilata]|uniref:DUF305 domain-containing protein n=1 Tax=Cellulomonas aerilata TaxID=515326 RepID=A0A512DBV4_9CELL|nr:DUF305 domain-containing protein [Cellulomonas aerilata]GEO33958.1 DUF305 domain-containing protein [Cellulomonas aerilata]
MTRRVTVVVALLVAVALAVGVLLGSVLVRQSPYAVPADTSVDAGFARDMQAHHGQAVELSRLVRDRTDDEAVRQLALDIMLTQDNQAGQMAGWLETWGLPQTSDQPPMTWAGTEHQHAAAASGDAAQGLASMPGWVSSADLARLDAARGVDAERLFLELMIPHHQGGVKMAQIAVDAAQGDQVRALARSIVRSQQAEITVLEDMLADRGGPLS